MRQRLGVGVIGLGVGERHVAAYASHPACRVVAVCDQDARVLARFRARYRDVPVVRHARALIARPDINVVSVASYDADHAAQIVAAVRAGKHVMAEKPLSLTHAETVMIRRTLKHHPNVALSSHLPLRTTDRFRKIRRLVQSGRLGQVYLAEAAYNYGRREKIVRGWRARATYYSAFLGAGVHLVDLLRYLTGDEVVAVTASANKIATAGTRFRWPDCVVALLKWESGMLATFAVNLACVAEHFQPVVLYGTRATVEHTTRGAFVVTATNSARRPQRIPGDWRQEKQADTDRVIHSFIDSIVGKGKPLVTVEDTFRAQSVCLAVDRALTTASRVRVNYL